MKSYGKYTCLHLYLYLQPSVYLCLYAKGWGEAHRVMMWNAKSPLQRCRSMDWSRDPGEGQPCSHQSLPKPFVLESGHTKAVGLLGWKSYDVVNRANTLNTSPRPGTKAIYCSYFRYNLCWLSRLLMTWDSNGNWFTQHLEQWSALPQLENAKYKSVGAVCVCVSVSACADPCGQPCMCTVYMSLCVSTENTCSGSSLARAARFSYLLDYQIWQPLTARKSFGFFVWLVVGGFIF